MTVRNVAYLRISKSDETVDNQLTAIKDFAQEDVIPFTEKIISGGSEPMSRKVFPELMEYIENMHPEKLYVYEISRIGRSMVDTFNIIQRLEKLGTMVISVSPKESWIATTDKSIRNLILAIFAWTADRERQMLKERTRNALNMRKEFLANQGYFISKRTGRRIEKFGRPARVIDWKKVDEYRSKRISYSAISRIMDIPYPTLIRKKSEIGTKNRNDGSS